MSTQDIPDNELDDFFKKLLEEPHIAFDEEAWAKMEQKMANTNRQGGAQRLFYALLLLLGAFTGIVSWYILDQKTTIALYPKSQIENLVAQPEKVSGKNTPAQATDPSPADLALNKNKDIPGRSEATSRLTDFPEITKNSSNEDNTHNLRKTDINTDHVQPGADQRNADLSNHSAKENTPVAQPEKPLTAEKGKSQFTDKPVKRVSASPGRKIITITQDKKLNTGGKKQTNLTGETVAPEITDQKNIQTNTPEKTAIVLSPAKQETGLSEENFRENTHTQWIITSISGLSLRLSESFSAEKVLSLSALANGTVPGVAIALEDTISKQALAKPRFKPGFGAGIVVSPDMSSVGFTNWDMPGTNAGFIIEYFISIRISFSTGAIYSTKIYKAAGKDYTPPKGFWGTYKIWPEEVDANCKVLDIPLNVRYNIIAREKFNVFAVSGLSSYLMLKENYKYIYSNTVNDKYLKKSWSTKNEFKHFFAVVNISAGYEQKFSNRVSIQAEPYLKIPLAGVGFGKIKLLSTGAFVSLKYKF